MMSSSLASSARQSCRAASRQARVYVGVQKRSMSVHVDRNARTGPEFASGPGGYSSNKGVVATVFGATGFLGRYVVDKLASQGITTIVPYRGNDMEPRHLKLMGDLGRVNPVPFDPRVVDSVRDVVRPSQVVINLIGKDFETKHFFGSLTKNYTYDQVHAEIPRMLAEVAKEQGVQQFIHMSSLAARPNALSKLDASKYVGEIAVRAHFPEATILRPSNIFGDEDRFMNKIAGLARFLPAFAMVNQGQQLVQPVYANDVGRAVANLVQQPQHQGETYNLAGPDVMSMKEVTEFVFHVIGRPPVVVDLPTTVLHGIGKFAEQFPGPWFTADQVTQGIQDNIIAEDEDNDLSYLLGAEPTSVEHASYRFLHQYRMGGHFAMD